VSTDADLLRTAAKSMRERAQAATPGPWWTYHRPSVEGVWASGRPGGAGRRVAYVPPYDTGAAAYIASWHPAAALAVADWLKEYADLYESSRHRHRPVFGDHEHAMALARAYLGDGAR
jgi:hypothetical protein